MNNLRLILSSFTKQCRPEDCGMACLKSIIKYAGQKIPAFSEKAEGGLSLLALDQLAKSAGLKSACVRMDFTALEGNDSPSILHTINDAGLPHFIVHYPYHAIEGFHLVGDPDRRLELISREALDKKWVSKAALYFEDIKPYHSLSTRVFPWNALANFKFVPKVLWISIPFLNVSAALLGVAISLIIQKATDPVFLGNRQSVFVLLFVLLSCISLAKCLLNYLRQWFMIGLGMAIDSKLAHTFLQGTFKAFQLSGKLPGYYYVNRATDVQKVHQAVALLTGVVLSDGILVMFMLGGLYYYQPILLVLQVPVIFSMFFVIDAYLPQMMIHIDQSQFPPARFSSQPAPVSGIAEFDIFSADYLETNAEWSKRTKAMSNLANKVNFSVELVVTVSLITVVILCICRMHAGVMSYQDFLMSFLLCYGLSLLMNKICNQLFAIVHGAQRLEQNLHGHPGCR